MKEKLKENFALFIEAMLGNYWLKDIDGHYPECNTALIELLGFNSSSEMIDKTDYEMPWVVYADELIKDDKEVIQNKIRQTKEIQLKKKDGQEITVLIVKMPLQNYKGAVVGTVAELVDLTKHKKEAENVQKRLESFIDSVAGNHWWKDVNGVYLGCNDTFVKTLQLKSQEDIIGKTDYELPWAETADYLIKNDQEVMSLGIAIEKEEQVTSNTGEKMTFMVMKAPLRDENRKIIGTVGNSIDITERKRMERNLTKAKEDANQAKTDFLENMRHDIRTPLTGIVGFANIIADEVKNTKVKEYVDNLTASSYALLDLLNEILEVIKITSKEIPLQKKKFDLQQRLTDVIKLNQSKAHQKNIGLLFDYDSTIPPYVIGDPTRIHRIVLELVANALNFTDKGFVKLSTQLAEKKKNRLVIKIIIEDSGIGIAPDKQQEIFLQFKRLTPSYQGIYKGAGLGLSIVKQFIDELEGEIYVDSQIGKGTKFTCVLPLKKPLLEEEFGSEKIVSTVAPKKQGEVATIVTPKVTESKEVDITKSRILLVEDQALAAIAVRSMLDGLNCQVDIASDGKTAVEWVKKDNYDLVFMDIGLPDIDGYEVTKRIRVFELSQDGHVPIIALTAHVDEENKQTCLNAGMNAVISKPLNKEKAKEILNGFIAYRERPQTKESESKLESKEKANYPKLKSEVINFELAKELLGGKEEMVTEMLNVLVSSFVEEQDKLKAAHKKEDWRSIAELAHKIKGGASYCGTVRLQEACAQMELAVKENKKELLADLYAQLLNEIKAVEEAVKNKSD